MEKTNRTWRTLLTVAAIVSLLAAAVMVLYRMDKRMRRLLCVLEHKLTPQKNTAFRVEL